jgi:hypothetical protein
VPSWPLRRGARAAQQEGLDGAAWLASFRVTLERRGAVVCPSDAPFHPRPPYAPNTTTRFPSRVVSSRIQRRSSQLRSGRTSNTTSQP